MTVHTPAPPEAPEFIPGTHCTVCFQDATEMVEIHFAQFDARCENHGGRPRDPDEIIRASSRQAD